MMSSEINRKLAAGRELYEYSKSDEQIESSSVAKAEGHKEEFSKGGVHTYLIDYSRIEHI